MVKHFRRSVSSVCRQDFFSAGVVLFPSRRMNARMMIVLFGLHRARIAYCAHMKETEGRSK